MTDCDETNVPTHVQPSASQGFDVFQDCQRTSADVISGLSHCNEFVPKSESVNHNLISSADLCHQLPSKSMPLAEISNFGNNEGYQDVPTSFAGVASGQNPVDRNLKCTSMKKFTCRYDIQIPNESQFRVARKIIGFKGGNMKKIIDACKEQDPRNKFGVKLRLRGRGSGFKEGPENCESDDDLHLCVSSQFLDSNGVGVQALFPFQNENVLKAYDVFKTACYYVESLLDKIYKEYQAFQVQKAARQKSNFSEPSSQFSLFGQNSQNFQNFESAGANIGAMGNF